VNVVDSSGWLEYFADGPGADFFAPAIERTARLIVPTLTTYEVFRRLRQQRGERVAFEAIAAMRQGTLVDLTADLALTAAVQGADRQLALADSVIYATAQMYGATLWTQDADFEGMAGVRYHPR
jgi:predicted nucleic acid-binding protein